jgi:integrase
VGEATQIQWGQVDLQGALIRLEGEQTKTLEARVVPLPDVLVETLNRVKKREGLVFNDTNLRQEWTAATKAAEMPGLLVHDLRRSAIRNLIAAGVPEKVAMSISGHKTRAVFDRYHIVDAADVVNAMSKLQNKQLVDSRNGESLVRGLLTEVGK